MPRLRPLRHALVPAAWLCGIMSALRSGRDPGYWATFDPATHFPWAQVLTVCAVITAESVALLLLLRPWSYRRHWGRALVASVAWCLPVAWELAHTGTDQPGYAYANLGFVMFLFPVLLVLTLISLFAANRERERRERAI